MLDNIWNRILRRPKLPEIFEGESFDEMHSKLRFERNYGLFTILSLEFFEFIKSKPAAKGALETMLDKFERMMCLLDDEGNFFSTPVREFEQAVHSACVAIDAEDMWETFKFRCEGFRAHFGIPSTEEKSRIAHYKTALADYESDLVERHHRLIDSLPTLKQLDGFVERHDPDGNRGLHPSVWREIGLVTGCLEPFSRQPFQHMPTNCEYFADDANGTLFFGLMKIDGQLHENSPVVRVGESRYGILATNLRDFLALGKKSGFYVSFDDLKSETQGINAEATALYEELNREFDLPSYEEVVAKIPDAEQQYSDQLQYACYWR